MANILDRMIAAVSPVRAAQRQAARLRLDGISRVRRMHYDGATTSHRSGGWRPTGTDANAEIRIAGERLRNVAREMVRNNPFAARAKSVIASNVIGAGVIPTVQTPNKATKRRLEALMRAHFDTPSCDYMGRTDLYGLQELAMSTIVEAGEVLIRKRPLRADSGAALPFQIQIMEPDYLDTLRDGPLPNGNRSIQGVEFDGSGRVVAYHLFNEHPGTSYPTAIQSERVPADYVLHVFRQDRPGQARGVTWFAPVILTMRDFSDYSEAQLMRQKISACFTAFVTSDDPESVGVDETDAGAPLQTFEPGTIERLRAGESVEFGAPPPITDYDAYSRVTLRSIAAGLGLSYEALTGDLSGVNFSSGRMGWLEFQRSIDSWRNHMLVPQMLYPIGQWFMEAVRITEGVSGSPTIKWTPPRREMISPRDEVPFAIEAIRAGLTTRSEHLRRSGYDPDVVDAELAAEQARADSLGLVLDTDARKRTAYGLDPNPNATPAGGNDNDETTGDERRYN